MWDEVTGELILRGKTALRLGLWVLLVSTLAYYLLGCVVGMNARHDKSLFRLSDDRWQLTECLYASAITLSTVGYTDLLGTERCVTWVDAEGRRRWDSATDAHADEGYDAATETVETDWSVLTRSVTAVQVIVGMAFFLYVIAQVTSFFTEGGHGEVLWRRRTARQLRRMEDHVVVCGAGQAALRAIERLRDADIECVLVESDAEAVRRFRRDEPTLPCLLGDATEEETLVEARVDSARALLALLPDDSLNLVSLVTAKALAPGLRIVARGMGESAPQRLTAAGANTVIGIEALAGLRAASELVRPTVVEFLDLVLRHGGDADIHFEGFRARVPEGGVTLADLQLRERAGIEAVAIRRKDEQAFHYNPPRDEPVHDGDEVAVLGSSDQMERARRALEEGPVRSQSSGDATIAIALPVEPTMEPETLATRRSDHFVICGAGLVGRAVVRELHALGRRFVVVDEHPEQIEDELPEGSVVVGDCREPSVLQRAGIAKARGLVSALPDDRDALVVAVTAFQARPDLRVVAVVREERAQRRIVRAGARVVALDAIAGRRVAADVLRPDATTFLDRMRSAPGVTRFESVRVTGETGAAGRTLAELAVFESTGIRVLALRAPGARDFVLNPSGNARMEVGTVLIGVGSPDAVSRLADLVGERE